MSQVKTDISPGSPPLLWSNVDQAFKEINQNFNQLQIWLNDQGVNPIDFNNLYTDLSPADNNQHTLGSISKTWKSLFLSSYLGTDSNIFNGLWLGSAHLRGVGGTVNLPGNSTVGGDPITGIGADLIIDPNKTFYKSVSVNGISVEAKNFNSTLFLNQGTGISLIGTAETESVLITNSGVTSITAGTAISINQSTGNVTITNQGVTSLTNSTILPSGRVAGSGISVNQSSGNVLVTNTGILSIDGGTGINVSTDTASGIATISVAFGIPLAFRNIEVPGQTTLAADTAADTLIIEPGYGIQISTSEPIGGEDTLTISLNPNIDINGSIFSDNSTLLVDAVNGKIVGEIDSLTGSILNLSSVNFDVENISAIGVSGVNIGAGGFNNLVVTAGGVDIQNVPLNANQGIIGNVTGNLSGNVSGILFGNVFGDLNGSVFSDNSTMLIDGTGGRIVGPLQGNSFSGTLDFDTSSWINVPGSSSVTVVSNTNDFVNSGSVDFSYAVGDRSVGFNINFSTPLTSTSKVRIAELQSDIIKGDLAGSVFGDNSTMLVDAINSVIPASVVSGTFVGKVIGDLSGSIFSDTSSMIVNGTDGTLMYYPSTAGDWDGTAPSTVGEALDRLAAVVKALNSGTGA